MSKLVSIAGVAGLIGSISSVVGVSVSNNRSTETADKTPTHKWNIEIPEPISAEVSCKGDVAGTTGKGMGNVTATLSWSMILNENDKETLKRGQKVSKEVKVSIKKKDDQEDLWPIMKGKENETLRVWVLPSTQKLEIKLTKTPEPPSGSEAYIILSSGENTKTLSCDAKGLTIRRGGGGGYIYGQGSQRGGYRNWIPHEDKNLNVGVSLKECKIKKGEVECSLNVVTGSDLNWSTKVTAKANVSFSL